MSPGALNLAAASGVVAASFAAILAQQPQVFRSRVLTVEVHATVRGPDGRLIQGLTKDDFELFDNGKRQDITVFSADVQPISVALLLDRSGSVVRQADKITAAAETFVRALLPADRAALHSLSYECQSLTNDKSRILAMLQSPMQTDMGSPVWSGLDRTITSLAGVTGRRAILLLSDGQDGGPLLYVPSVRPPGPCSVWSDLSEASLNDASRRAQREGIMVYTVTVESAPGLSNDDDLRAIARGSGGERYRLKQESELGAAFARVVDELHHQYLLGFVPDAFDGKVHSLTVRVKRPGLSVRARESYAAIELDGPASRAAAATEPLKPLSAGDVDAAIRQGSAGQKAQAACMAFGTFAARPDENDVFAEVVFEGPIGRIMRAAREAKVQRTTFGAAQVTDTMRAPEVHATVEMKKTLRPSETPITDATNPIPTPTPTPTPSPPVTGFTIDPRRGSVSPVNSSLVVTAVRVRSKVLTEVVLSSIGEGSSPAGVPSRPGFESRRVERFDLAAFRALPGSDVEVVVRSPVGVRYCSINAKERAAIR